MTCRVSVSLSVEPAPLGRPKAQGVGFEPTTPISRRQADAPHRTPGLRCRTAPYRARRPLQRSGIHKVILSLLDAERAGARFVGSTEQATASRQGRGGEV